MKKITVQYFLNLIGSLVKLNFWLQAKLSSDFFFFFLHTAYSCSTVLTQVIVRTCLYNCIIDKALKLKFNFKSLLFYNR